MNVIKENMENVLHGLVSVKKDVIDVTLDDSVIEDLFQQVCVRILSRLIHESRENTIRLRAILCFEA